MARLTEKQLEERKAYIGASECAAVLGVSRYSTPLEVWSKKTGRNTVDSGGNRFTEAGHRLERTILEWFSEETGIKLEFPTDTFKHEDYDFIACNLDAQVDGTNIPVEAKNVSVYKEDEWGDDDNPLVPVEYHCQVMHQIMVRKAPYGYICALLGGNKFVWRKVAADGELIGIILKGEVSFWKDFVLADEPPMTDPRDDLNAIFPKDNGKEIILDEKWNEKIVELNSLKADISSKEKLKEGIENEIKLEMSEASIGRTSEFEVSYKSFTSKRVDNDKVKALPNAAELMKESVGRRFNIKPLKK